MTAPDLALDLWTAIDEDGDEAAYNALIDFYLDSGNEKAAAGVRRAKPTRRRPFQPLPDHKWTWMHSDATFWQFRSALPSGTRWLTEMFAHPTLAWEFLADYAYLESRHVPARA